MNKVEQIIYGEEIYRITPSVTIIIDKPWSQMAEEYRVLLGKILQAIGLTLSTVTILHQETLNLSVLAEKSRLTLAFIQPPSGVPTYEPIHTGPSSTVVSEPLEIIAAQEDSKRKLWSCLKGMVQP